MPNFTCYLAEPIDFGSADESVVMRAQGEMAAMGWTVYSPKQAFSSVAPQPDDAISRINEAAMDAATGAVAFLPGDARSVGVPAEIGHLLATGTPVLIASDLDKSWVLRGWAGHANAEVVGLDEEEVSAGLDWLRDAMRLGAALDTLPHQRAASEAITFGATSPNATLPTRGYSTDAGFDLYTSEDTVIPPRGFADVPCGVSVDLPDGTWGLVTGRSSTLRKRRLLVSQGVIDEEYTGPLFAGCENLTDEPVTVKAGERVAQLIVHEALGPRYQPTWGEMRAKARGANGFGSTGR